MGGNLEKPHGTKDFDLDYWTQRLQALFQGGGKDETAFTDLCEILAKMDQTKRELTLTALFLKLGLEGEKLEKIKKLLLENLSLLQWHALENRKEIERKRAATQQKIRQAAGVVMGITILAGTGYWSAQQEDTVGPTKIEDGTFERKVFYKYPRILDWGERETVGLFEERHCDAIGRRTRTLYLPHRDKDGKGVPVTLIDTWSDSRKPKWEDWNDPLKTWISDVELLGIENDLYRYAQQHPEAIPPLLTLDYFSPEQYGRKLEGGSPYLPNMNNTAATWLTQLPQNACDK